MKKLFIIIPIVILLLSGSCNLIWDVDTTENLSYISTKPVLTLIGDPIMELTVGEPYTEQGVDAVAADTVLEYSIIQGVVDDDTEGFYSIVYEAINGFDWRGYAYRAVLVHDGTPYTENLDIAGSYQFNYTLDNVTILKYDEVNGYWQVNNAWGQEGYSFPLIFADMGDSTYSIVPQEHHRFGRYSGTAVYYEEGTFIIKKKIDFSIHLESKESPDVFTWELVN